MKLCDYKIVQNDNKFKLMARERALPIFELLITEPFEVPTSIKLFCCIPVIGFLLLFTLILLVVYSREFWETLEISEDPLKFVTTKTNHIKMIQEQFEKAKTHHKAWQEYMNL